MVVELKACGSRLLTDSAGCGILCDMKSISVDPATSYVSVGSGDATIVDLGDQFAVVFSNAQSSATLTALQDCYLLRSLVVGGGGGGGVTQLGGSRTVALAKV